MSLVVSASSLPQNLITPSPPVPSRGSFRLRLHTLPDNFMGPGSIKGGTVLQHLSQIPKSNSGATQAGATTDSGGTLQLQSTQNNWSVAKKLSRVPVCDGYHELCNTISQHHPPPFGYSP